MVLPLPAVFLRPHLFLDHMDTHKLCGSPGYLSNAQSTMPAVSLEALPAVLPISPFLRVQPTHVLKAAFQLSPSTPPLALCHPLCMLAFSFMFASCESLCHLPRSLTLVSFTWQTHMAMAGQMCPEQS